MIAKLITAYGKPTVLVCDARCDKAWGIQSRPKIKFGDDPDDYAFLSDSETGEAPADPGTYEGCDGKPSAPGDRLNRWCFRECERSDRTSTHQEFISPKDLSSRVYNQPWKHGVSNDLL